MQWLMFGGWLDIVSSQMAPYDFAVANRNGALKQHRFKTRFGELLACFLCALDCHWTASRTTFSVYAIAWKGILLTAKLGNSVLQAITSLQAHPTKASSISQSQSR
jgi:hypothetical protein